MTVHKICHRIWHIGCCTPSLACPVTCFIRLGVRLTRVIMSCRRHLSSLRCSSLRCLWNWPLEPDPSRFSRFFRFSIVADFPKLIDSIPGKVVGRDRRRSRPPIKLSRRHFAEWQLANEGTNLLNAYLTQQAATNKTTRSSANNNEILDDVGTCLDINLVID